MTLVKTAGGHLSPFMLAMHSSRKVMTHSKVGGSLLPKLNCVQAFLAPAVSDLKANCPRMCSAVHDLHACNPRYVLDSRALTSSMLSQVQAIGLVILVAIFPKWRGKITRGLP